MHVEYVLANGRRITIAVPYERWLNQGHVPVGDALVEMIADLDLQAARRSAKITE